MAGKKKSKSSLKESGEQRASELMARKKKRKRRRAAVLILVPLLVLSLMFYYLLNYFFRVTEVVVEGDSRYTTEEIEAASKVVTGDKLVMLSKKEVCKNITSALPYAGEVMIHRSLPSTLKIKVKDTYPIAMIEAGDVCYLIDQNQKVLEIVDSNAKLAIPRIRDTGIAEEPALGKNLAFSDQIVRKIHIDILQVLADNKMLEQVEYIDLSDRLSLKIQYDHRIIIDLGDYLSLEEKISFAKTIITDKLEPADRGRLNVFSAKKSNFLPQDDLPMLTDRRIS